MKSEIRSGLNTEMRSELKFAKPWNMPILRDLKINALHKKIGFSSPNHINRTLKELPELLRENLEKPS